jgi:hypothetical protein
MNMNEPPSLLRNDYSGKHNWLIVQLTGRPPNTAAIGAAVTVTSGKRSQVRTVLSQSSYYSHDDLRLHFGLGSAPAPCTSSRVSHTHTSSATFSLPNTLDPRDVRINGGAFGRVSDINRS